MGNANGERTISLDQEKVDTNTRVDFYERASEENLAPLWKVLAGLVAPLPRPKATPYRWRFSEVRPYLMEACSLISTEEAERRVLILENPSLRTQSRVCDSLFAGLQIILPNEVAPAHRHVASALRFIMEGSNAYTAVDGERTMMEPGDFVITPSWTWHDHGNVGDAPMIWLDGLDMHIVNLLSASFREEMHTTKHALEKPDDASSRMFGAAMAPAGHKHDRPTSPIINYRYSRARALLKEIAASQEIDSSLGHIIKYLNPLTGDWAMPTIATQMRLLPAGFESTPYQSTDSTVFVVVEGRGTSQIGDESFDWEQHDVFVAPSWFVQRHQAKTESVIFTYSDRAVQEKLHLWREHRGSLTS